MRLTTLFIAAVAVATLSQPAAAQCAPGGEWQLDVNACVQCAPGTYNPTGDGTCVECDAASGWGWTSCVSSADKTNTTSTDAAAIAQQSDMVRNSKKKSAESTLRFNVPGYPSCVGEECLLYFNPCFGLDC